MNPQAGFFNGFEAGRYAERAWWVGRLQGERQALVEACASDDGVDLVREGQLALLDRLLHTRVPPSSEL